MKYFCFIVLSFCCAFTGASLLSPPKSLLSEAIKHNRPNNPALLSTGGALAEDIDKSDTWNLGDLEAKDFLYVAIQGVLVGAVFWICHHIPRTGGQAPSWIPFSGNLATAGMHASFFLIGLVVASLLPEGLAKIIFSPPSVALIGFVLPAVESVKAAVTSGGADDRAWLIYWVIQGIFQYSTEFMDQLAIKYEAVYKYWHTLELLLVLWLVLPITDGATLAYNLVAQPYLLPVVQYVKKYCDGWLATIAVTTINTSYVYWFSFIFMSLPTFIKRTAVIAVGSVFPVLSTVMALTAAKESKQVMRWLTYWPCFSLLFLVMIGMEKFVGSFKGLYIACLAATLYLMLPMFDGSTLIFREVLVPLLGQRELLLLRDAQALADDFVKHLPADRQQNARESAARAFMPKSE